MLHRQKPVWFATAVLAVVALASSACGSPPPTPGETQPASAGATATPPGTTPAFITFPYRIIMTGPATAPAGTDIVYMLQYQRVLPDVHGIGNSIVITYNMVGHAVPAQPAATLVSVTAAAGPPPGDLGPQIPGFSNNYALEADAGTLRIVVRLAPGFTDALTVGFYVKGTSIDSPPGTVDEVTTQVIAGAMLPGTGSGPQAAQPTCIVVAVVLMAFAAVVMLAGRLMACAHTGAYFRCDGG